MKSVFSAYTLLGCYKYYVSWAKLCTSCVSFYFPEGKIPLFPFISFPHTHCYFCLNDSSLGWSLFWEGASRQALLLLWVQGKDISNVRKALSCSVSKAGEVRDYWPGGRQVSQFLAGRIWVCVWACAPQQTWCVSWFEGVCKDLIGGPSRRWISLL